MARIALWTFDEKPGSDLAEDKVTDDGTAQHGKFQEGATTTGSGSGVFDGKNDYVEIPTDKGFDLDTGSVAITFTQNTASIGDDPWGDTAAQTLFSRDSTGFDEGGHLTIFVKSDGSVGVRHQDTESSHVFEGGDVPLGKPVTVIYAWGPSGSRLYVDGVLVDGGNQALTMGGNSEPITIGASQAQSGDGTADNLKGHFDGEIAKVAIYNEPIKPGGAPCFTHGTLILTPDGEIPIEALRVGDLVCTRDHGPQPIRWIGSRAVVLRDEPRGDDRLRPVRIVAGALGNGLPRRDLLVSRQHRMLISSRIAARMFGTPSVLGAAVKLSGLPGIFIDHGVRTVTYVHLMFDQHEIIFAEGAPTESLYLGPETLKMVPAEARQEILELFPALARGLGSPRPARPIPDGRTLKTLVARHARNKKPLLEVALAADMPAPSGRAPHSGPIAACAFVESGASCGPAARLTPPEPLRISTP
ncbi:Hint domain-containing protein [Dinoroseobacter sp. PD6]|uniref:Hint domain-containing protein n=1 Tax=Dinoroseobacter sp. PD6 TaxID=3028384 RepID=UPI00237AAFE3|nr:Hint domain-containing protein [Dinoroseobacter sp. PD6]MDD9718421.1 Hint domain-containing protein [Dinoroseobacter sp. PD6]